jgi:tRNA-specific 2-thiouridylase
VAAAERLYVVGLDAEADEVTVGPRHAGMSSGVRIVDCNRLGSWPPGRSLQIKHRYNEPAVDGWITCGEGQGAELRFAEPQSGVAPGQAAVLYDGERILGGGWIDQTVAADSPLAEAATAAPLPA